MPYKGTHHTQKSIKELTAANIKTWNNPEVKKKHKEALLKSWRSVSRRKKMSDIFKRLWKTESFRNKKCKENHWNWKGGRIKNYAGYVYILDREHPYCDHHGYVREHRLVVERQICKHLKPEEVVHHRGKKSDNRPHMLMAFINEDIHKKFHKNPALVKPKEIIFDGRLLHPSPLKK